MGRVIVPPTFKSALNERKRLMNEEVSSSLEEAISKCQLVDVPADRFETIDRYCKALWSMNEKINLTRHTNYDLFVRRDLLDSYQLAKLLQENEEILDVGTGGGVPGVLVAILRPDVQVSLCDSVQKKAKAVSTIITELDLPIPVYEQSVQAVLEDFTFDSLTSRAVGSLTTLCNWFQDRWHCFGRMLAIKGPKWVEERGEARHRGLLKEVRLRKLASYPMPGTESSSVILELRRQVGATGADGE